MLKRCYEDARKFLPSGFSSAKTHHPSVPDTVPSEARHGKAFAGLLKRYFG